MTGGGSSIPAVQRLLRVLAAGRRVAEIGTAYGDGRGGSRDATLARSKDR